MKIKNRAVALKKDQRRCHCARRESPAPFLYIDGQDKSDQDGEKKIVPDPPRDNVFRQHRCKYKKPAMIKRRAVKRARVRAYRNPGIFLV